MRTTSNGSSVRLYFLDAASEGGAAVTLLYGTLDEAMQLAAQQSAEDQEGLFIATDNDVVAYLDLLEG